jgi:hypothetical protein
MTNIILNKLEKKNELKKGRKLWISRSKGKSKFKDGTLNLNKNFMSYGDKFKKPGNSNHGNKGNFKNKSNNFKK